MFVNEVIPVLEAAHIPRDDIFEWDADYTYVPHLDAGFDATQFTDKALGRSLDESEVTLRFLSIAKPAYSFAQPKAKTYACEPFKRQKSKAACRALIKNEAHFNREISAQRTLLRSQHCYAHRKSAKCVAELHRGDQEHAALTRLLATSRVQP
jgi:hypothetical protein